MNRELVRKEIQLKEDECCIVFDLACYFPYSNQEILTFDFSLGMEEFTDYKRNHRYPNVGYETISKKYGKRVSKLGYPYIMKLDNQAPMLLVVKVGIKEECMSLVFPVQTSMTKEQPVCGLTMRYMFDESKFSFITYKKAEDGCGWNVYRWFNHEIGEDAKQPNDVVLNPPHLVGSNEKKATIVYENILTPSPSRLDDFLIL